MKLKRRQLSTLTLFQFYMYFRGKSVQNSLKFTYPIQGYCSFVNLYADKISASSCGESVPNYILIKYIDTKMKLSLLLLETHFWT